MVLVKRGDWQSGIHYEKGDLVKGYDGKHYVCVKSTPHGVRLGLEGPHTRYFAQFEPGKYEKYFFKKEKKVKKQVKKSKEESLPKTIKEMRTDLQKIQPEADEGTAIVHVQAFGMSISVPLPDVGPIKNVLKRGAVKNRTFVDVGDVRIGLDIV